VLRKLKKKMIKLVYIKKKKLFLKLMCVFCYVSADVALKF